MLRIYPYPPLSSSSNLPILRIHCSFTPITKATHGRSYSMRLCGNVLRLSGSFTW